MARRTILITGANTGIGAAAARELAGPDVHLVLACRSEAKTTPVLEELRSKGATAEFLALDLGSIADAKRAAERFAERCDRLDVLIDNAGVARHVGLTKDGFELAFGTNHLGHFAFTVPLLPLLERSAGRVVLVASGNHYRTDRIPWDALRTPGRGTALPQYDVSKLANVLFAAELRRRHPKLGVVALNPGRIASDIWRRVPQPFRAIMRVVMRMKPVEFGGHTLVHAANVELGPDAPLYFDKTVARAPNPAALDETLARELWGFSERAVREYASASRVDPDAIP